MKKNNLNIYSNTFILPAFLIYFVFFLLPAILGTGLSFTDWYIDRLFSPRFVGFQNFINIIQASELKLALKNTFVFAIITVILKNILGLFMAMIVNSSLVKCKNYYRIVFYFPNIMCMVVVGLLFSSIYQPNGLINSFLGVLGLNNLQMDWLMDTRFSMYSISLMDVWQGVGFHMVIYLAGLVMISKDYYEACKIDGGNIFQEFRYITLPLILPTFNINFILTLITGLKVFIQVYVLTNGGPGNATEVISTTGYKLFGEGRLGLSSAYITLLTAIISIFCIIYLNISREKEVEL